MALAVPSTDHAAGRILKSLYFRKAYTKGIPSCARWRIPGPGGPLFKFAALQSCARRKAHYVLSFACGTRDKLNPYAARPGNPTYSSGQRSSSKKTRSPVGKRVFERAVNALGNYSSSLSLASSASSVSTSWLSSSSREAISSLMAPLTNPLVIWSPARTSQPSSSSNVRDCGSNDPRTSQLVQIGCRESWHRHISATTCLSTRMRVMRRHA